MRIASALWVNIRRCHYLFAAWSTNVLNILFSGWLEALVSRVAEDRKRVVCPVIDMISDATFAYGRSFELHWGALNWDLHFRWYTRTEPNIIKGQKDITQAFRTPALAGGLDAMDKSYFFELGGYDERMEIWGGENLELSFRVGIELFPQGRI